MDVSSLQPAISSLRWRSLDIDFAYIRCGKGNAPHDSRFVQHMTAARTAGIVVGAYHVGFPLRPDPSHPGREPEAQCDAHFMSCGALGQLSGTLPIALDLEWPLPVHWGDYGIDAAYIVGWAERYLNRARSAYGRVPMLYTYPDFWAHLIDGSDVSSFSQYRLWLADYSAGAETHTVEPWISSTMVQVHGGDAKWVGGGKVDEDVFPGDEESWTCLLST